MFLGIVFWTDEHSGGAVSERGGRTRGDRTALIKGQFQLGQGIQSGAGSQAAILVDARAIHLDGYNFAVQSAVRLRRCRLFLACHCKLFLFGAGNLVLAANILSGLTHRHVRSWHMSIQHWVRHGVEAPYAHAAHRFDTRADKDFPSIHLNGTGSKVNRLHGWTTEAINGRARDSYW